MNNFFPSQKRKKLKKKLLKNSGNHRKFLKISLHIFCNITVTFMTLDRLEKINWIYKCKILNSLALINFMKST